ncbi:MAG: HTH domain-containing protein, partial [Dehalococcoidia bacterium]|nr:HTH domain-containing protein [Dehalococcoidia bacterium]
MFNSSDICTPELAERFDVSRRTILRDIDTLCLTGIPIVT